METTFILAQCAGLLALAIEIIRFQFKKSRGFFLVEPILSSLYAIQFYLLNAPAATLTSAIGILRGTCAISLSQKTMQKCIIGIFIPAYAIVTINVYENFIDLLPATALFCSSLAFMFQNNRYLVARLYVLNNCIWFIYAINYDAYAQILTCILVSASLLIGIIRHEDFYKQKFNFLLQRAIQKSPA